MKGKSSLTTSDVSKWMQNRNFTELQRRRLLRTLLSLPTNDETTTTRKGSRYYFTILVLIVFMISNMTMMIIMYQDNYSTITTKYSFVSGIPTNTSCEGNENEIAIAIGIISALKNRDLRNAARETWLNSLHMDKNIEYKFFLGVDENGSIPSEVRVEATKYRDMIFTQVPDAYGSISFRAVSIFQWGVEQCGAHYIVRANDDVYLRVNKIFESLRKFPPVNIYAGHMFEAGAAIVVRPEQVNYECTSKKECKIREKTRKAQAVSIATYPSDKYPAFAQGNAVILSRDLAQEVASLARKPYVSIFCDDVMIGTMVSRFHPRYVHIKADMSLHESGTLCSDDAINHFDIGPESMRILFSNDNVENLAQCHGLRNAFL